MSYLNSIQEDFFSGRINKKNYIESMYAAQHSKLFDYAAYLPQTNIKKIEIEDGSVVMTTRDKGLRIACVAHDHRLAPIETLNFYDYERAEALMMERLFSGCSTYFDIGANIGYHSLGIAASYRDAKVYCFEPIPSTYQALCSNVKLNNIKNIQTHNFGLSDKIGTFPFYLYPEGSGNASTENLSDRDSVKVVDCELRTLDGFLEKNPVLVDFLKCDVEGAELFVFQGALKTLELHKPIVFTEILRKWSAKFHYDPNAILQLFSGLGYRAYTVEQSKLCPFERMTESTVETNFFFLHDLKHEQLIKQYIL
jgi:FkbM family methyltransferase